jgi:hypothetical protein
MQRLRAWRKTLTYPRNCAAESLPGKTLGWRLVHGQGLGPEPAD